MVMLGGPAVSAEVVTALSPDPAGWGTETLAAAIQGAAESAELGAASTADPAAPEHSSTESPATPFFATEPGPAAVQAAAPEQSTSDLIAPPPISALSAVLERLVAPAVSFVGYLPVLAPQATGATGPGFDWTEAGIAVQLQLKYGYYANPVAHGISDIGPEGRMFRAAVDRGLVPDSVEGLGTLLAHLSPARKDQHPAARAFFEEWFASPAARDVRLG